MRGMIQVYTGNGKGKTTAAIGLCVRAIGAGKKVLILQFMKAKGYSEQIVLAGFASQLTLETVGRPFFIAPEGAIPNGDNASWKDHVVTFPPGKPPVEYQEIIDGGLVSADEALAGGEYDLVVLDEVNVALHFGLIAWDRMEAMLDRKAEATEVVLTGRGAPRALMEKADLVTEMIEIKHYYNEGVEARKGIEH